jgi:hypothetical protein
MIKWRTKIILLCMVAFFMTMQSCVKHTCYVCDPLPPVYYECHGTDTIRIANFGYTKTMQQKVEYYRSLGYYCFDSAVTIMSNVDPTAGQCLNESIYAYAKWNGYNCYKDKEQ